VAATEGDSVMARTGKHYWDSPRNLRTIAASRALTRFKAIRRFFRFSLRLHITASLTDRSWCVASATYFHRKHRKRSHGNGEGDAKGAAHCGVGGRWL